MPRLSVILPARNAEDTVGLAVSSTLRAMPKDSELLVLDDGSTDGTASAALAAGNDDTRLRVESHPPSGGITPALNWLIANTDSDLVARMDADDISAPWRFKLSLPYMKKTDILFNQVRELHGEKASFPLPLGISPQVFPLYLLLSNPVSHPTMLATRAILDRVGGYRQVPSEDYDLWVRAALEGARLRRTAMWGLDYRMHEGQITASESWRNASWQDPELGAAFSQLAQQVVGEPMSRIVSMSALPADERAIQLRRARDLITPHINNAPLAHKLLLRRRLNQRIDLANTSARD